MKSSRLFCLLFVVTVSTGVANDAVEVAVKSSSFQLLARKIHVAGGKSKHEFLAKKSKEPNSEDDSPPENLNDPSKFVDEEHTDDQRINIKIGTSQSDNLEDYDVLFEIPMGGKTIVIMRELLTWEKAGVSMTLTLGFGLLAGFLWHQNKEWPDPVPGIGSYSRLSEGWSSGICGWPEDCVGCVMACCCICVSWADTMSMTGLLSFWVAFSIVLIIMLLEGLPVLGIAPALHIVMVIMFAYFRQQIRGMFEMESDISTMVGDCCCYFWCTACSLSQDSRHVVFAARLGHEAVCAQRPIGLPIKPIASQPKSDQDAAQLGMGRTDTAYLEG